MNEPILYDNQTVVSNKSNMARAGFVYLLRNEYMPDLVKIGCTTRSPSTRAAEISNATGVPAPFQLLCFTEFEDCQAAERALHTFCSSRRINNSREFFHASLAPAVGWLWWHPDRLGFCDFLSGRYSPTGSELVMMVREELGRPAGLEHFSQLENPFREPSVSDGGDAGKLSSGTAA